jgi:glutamyl-tRNA synthetase
VSQPVRVRFAPSPTGKLHIGGARTALFNWAFARGLGGVFLLRVEDTDRERSTAEYEVAILDGLRWLGIDWDEGPEVGGAHGPYRQSEREEGHHATAHALLEAGHAYRCFCTPVRLDELRERQQAAKETPRYDGLCRSVDAAEAARRAEGGEPNVIRFRVPEGETRFTDLIRGDVRFANEEVDDWVMVRQSGAPTYNFVVVCDDSAMEITHVLRGEEHLTNTPKQVLLYGALGLEPPAFGHLPLMLGSDGKKLSKRTGDTALQDYRDAGYPPEAVVNFLALQGWALDGETEVFSREQLVESFRPEAVSKGGSIFDLEKFQWLAGEYLRGEPVEQLADHCAPYVQAAGQATAAELAERRDWFLRVVEAERERIRLYGELPARIAYLFVGDDAVEYDPKAEKGARKHEARVSTLEDYLGWLSSRLEQGVDTDALRDDTKAWVGERGLKIPGLFQPLRCALTGLPGGPDLFEIMALLGPAAVRARIEQGARRLA